MGRLGVWFYSILVKLKLGGSNTVQDGDNISVDDILELVYATNLLLKTVFSNKKNDRIVQNLESVIRYFLLCFDKVDGRKEDKVASWVTQYNLLCLLSVPNIVREYGNMRNVWEGGIDGESYLKKTKKEFTGGMVNEWQTWVITNLLQKNLLHDWMATEDKKLSVTVRKYCKIYKNTKIVKNEIEKKNPLSGIVVSSKIYIVHYEKDEIMGLEIKLLDGVINNYRLLYFHIEVTNNKIVLTNEYLNRLEKGA
jgi:hypothetical protein